MDRRRHEWKSQGSAGSCLLQSNPFLLGIRPPWISVRTQYGPGLLKVSQDTSCKQLSEDREFLVLQGTNPCSCLARVCHRSDGKPETRDKYLTLPCINNIGYVCLPQLAEQGLSNKVCGTKVHNSIDVFYPSNILHSGPPDCSSHDPHSSKHAS